ncbi:MAG: hypothetical protein IPL92_17540 [Saprospiraceae bacterium]|nr:hypothetical protein [Candidatus Opimibacter iunctus]
MAKENLLKSNSLCCIWIVVDNRKRRFDGDGDSDFILGNLGWNNKFGGSKGTNLEVYSGDLDHNGDNDVILAMTKRDLLAPVRGRDWSAQEMLFIRSKYPPTRVFAKAKW